MSSITEHLVMEDISIIPAFSFAFYYIFLYISIYRFLWTRLYVRYIIGLG